jgi:hypothetical protein
MSVDWNLIVEISKAFLTPVIAVVATYVAWQQWKTNALKVKLDRYDRRVRVYEEVKKMLSIVMRDADIDAGELLAFRSSTAEAGFLFGPEILKYIDELYRRGSRLSVANKQYRANLDRVNPGYDHQKVTDVINQEIAWLSEQFIPARDIFKPYLDISQ